ncbi:MAG TPA: alpha/beta hydrolase [Chloroflexota bacterium]|jgi:acetyl esterase/lipase
MVTRRTFLQSVGAAGAAVGLASRRPASAAAQAPAYDPTPRFDVRTSDVEYRRDGAETFLARVYQPEGAGPFRGLIYIHGGQWVNGSREGADADATALAASGLVVFAPDFHNASPEHPYPDAAVDVNYATRWFKAHAGEFGAAAEGIGGMGASSGGHLIMLSAMRPRDPRYAALPLPEAAGLDSTLAYAVLVWPILDPLGRFIFAQATGRDDIVQNTRTFFRPWEGVWEGNPTTILERGEAVELPPALIIQGTIDANVTPALQQRFAGAYRAAGGRVDVEIFPDRPHQFTRQAGPETDRAHALIRAFIARELSENLALD